MTSSKPKTWASLITNLDYLPGLLTLNYSLQTVKSAYPLVALYTSAFPPEGLAALRSRGIAHRLVPCITPTAGRMYEEDARFNDTWTKLVAFSLEEYDRLVLLDGDMLVRRNMDELMLIPLDEGGDRVFAACHACACNPLNKSHYPPNWTPNNCAYTAQHSTPSQAQTNAPPSTAGVAMLNSGLLVINPSAETWDEIQDTLADPERTRSYDFPDQELLSDTFAGRWVPLPYVYNALKTLRWENVHAPIWRDEEVKNVHYIFARKPWHGVEDQSDDDPTHRWWWEVTRERKTVEKEKLGIEDRF